MLQCKGAVQSGIFTPDSPETFLSEICLVDAKKLDSTGDVLKVPIYYGERFKTKPNTKLLKQKSSDNELVNKESHSRFCNDKQYVKVMMHFSKNGIEFLLSHSAFNSQRSFKPKPSTGKWIQSSFTSALFHIRCRPSKRKRRKHTILNLPNFHVACTKSGG